MSETLMTPSSYNLEFLEDLYARYQIDPGTVDPKWREYFAAWGGARGNGPVRTGPSFVPRSIFHAPARRREDEGQATTVVNGTIASRELAAAALQDRVDQLIRNYRVRGHMIARINPLGLSQPEPAELDYRTYGFTEADLDRPFSTTSLPGPNVRTLRDILRQLRKTYCRSIAAQFMHIDELKVREWLQQRMEGTENRIKLSRDEQIRIFTRLTDAVIFEQFIQKKYVGAKSFSLEGCESLIPLLDLAIEKAGEQGIVEVVIGMAHRGRLSVLANILGKSPRYIFREFDDVDPDLHTGGGDVKYHLGYSNNWTTAKGKKIHLSLCFNPSHLEFVNPVVLGRLRAKQDRTGDRGRERGLALIIHGDAAFAGEGVVQETLNMSELVGYSVGGALHVIVNNQIGFTTGPNEGRSCTYATDVAKMLQIPIFHVNGEAPEAVAQVVNLALEFRREFRRDVVIDMYGFRRHGHNESDEPSFTQPLLYKTIKERESVGESYAANLVLLGEVKPEETEAIVHSRHEHLEAELSYARSPQYERRGGEMEELWRHYKGGLDADVPEVDTGVSREVLSQLLYRLTELPAGFHAHRTIQRLLQQRRAMATGEKPLDWSAAEALAFATLAVQGTRIRLTGQDSRRGTFSHRHAFLFDTETGEGYCPLEHLADNQAAVEIHNSPLTETGVLGFEYGYSLDYPDALVLWEAQFGDFVNCAQVIIDQFITSAEDKWRRLSSLVMLLPHGFEGAGPEHSSARLERFLNQAAEDNIQVVCPTTPAQLFHLLRRQVVRPWRKPLVVMTPKSLLRHPDVTSSLDELAEGRFARILADASVADPKKVKRVLLCTGKIYYELAEKRKELGRSDAALIRLEQLYPLAPEQLQAALSAYRRGVEIRWVQEEPENMGAAWYVQLRLGEVLRGKGDFRVISRPESASPATGSANSHKLEQAQLLAQAFA